VEGEYDYLRSVYSLDVRSKAIGSMQLIGSLGEPSSQLLTAWNTSTQLPDGSTAHPMGDVAWYSHVVRVRSSFAFAPERKLKGRLRCIRSATTAQS